MKLFKISFNISKNKVRGPQVQGNCSPTAIALGSSAIVKVPGQNCFRALCASLGQIRLGPPEGSAEGSTKVPAMCTKVPPKFLKFRGVSCSLGQVRLGPRGSTKVPPRFHQGCTTQVSRRSTTVAQVSLSVADPSWAAERFRLKKVLWKVPPRFHQGHASFVISLVFWGRSVLGRQKVLWKVPPSLL